MNKYTIGYIVLRYTVVDWSPMLLIFNNMLSSVHCTSHRSLRSVMAARQVIIGI